MSSIEKGATMALTTVTVHGELLNLDGLTPAVGTVTFRTLIELRDTVDNIVYPPATFTATLDLLGEFTIVLPATDNADLVPASWVYQVYIATDTWTQTIYVQIPFQVGTVELADLTPLDYDPCAGLPLPEPLSPSEYEALLALIAALQAEDVALDARLDVVEITMGALVATVNIHTGQITALQNAQTATQADLDALEAVVAPMPGQIATLQGNAGLVGPTAFVTVTAVAANITVATAAPPGSRLERGADATRFRGFLQATGAVGAGSVLANVATVAHRPLVNKSFGVRYTAGSARMQFLTNGDLVFGAALALNDQVWIDSITVDLAAP